MKSFPSSWAHRHRAFSLVEIMIVVTIIGILAVIALPAMVRVQQASKNSRFVSDLRTFAQGFETYAITNGGWPPNAGTGVVPPGMTGIIKDSAWSAVNSVGGRWNWDYNNFGITASISTINVTATDAQMTLVDTKIDDGNLSTGHFQKNGSRFLFILEP